MQPEQLLVSSIVQHCHTIIKLPSESLVQQDTELSPGVHSTKLVVSPLRFATSVYSVRASSGMVLRNLQAQLLQLLGCQVGRHLRHKTLLTLQKMEIR